MSTGKDDMPTRGMNDEHDQRTTPSGGHGEMPTQSMHAEHPVSEAHAQQSSGASQTVDAEMAAYLQSRQGKARTEVSGGSGAQGEQHDAAAKESGRHGEMPVKGME